MTTTTVVRTRCEAAVFDYANPLEGKQCSRPASEVRGGRPVCWLHGTGIRIAQIVTFMPKGKLAKS
jgi:hypothetical protein